MRNRAVSYVERIGGTCGRVRVIKLSPSDEAAALRQPHCDDDNHLNPDGAGWVVRSWLELDNAPGESVFILREEKDDPATETRIPLTPQDASGHRLRAALPRRVASDSCSRPAAR